MEQLKLNSTLNKNGSITSVWSAVSGAVRYQLYMFTPGDDFVYFNETLTTTSYTSQADLVEGRYYQVNLLAFNSSNVNFLSDSQTLYIPYGFYDDTPLGIPGNITADPTAIWVTVNWDAVPRATSYDVLFNGTVYNTAGTSRMITGLTPGTSYSYQIRARNATLTGAYSGLKTVTTLPQTPAVPGNISKSSTESTATVGWGAVSGTTGYDLQFNGTTYAVNGTSKKFTGLTPNKSYSFQVRSRNGDITSAYSPANTVTTTPNAPAAPGVSVNENSVTISWDAVAGAASYDILLNGTLTNVTGTSHTFTGLSPNTGYTYQIRTNNADGSSSYSTSKAIKTAPNPPASPNVSATTDSVTISFSAVPGATSYDILFNGVTYNLTGTSRTFTGLSPGVSYTYQIRSNSTSGSSSYSAPQTVTTTPVQPAVPANVSARATHNSVTVSWSAVSGAASYDVLFNGSAVSASGTTKTFSGLTPDRSYSYQVRARNAAGTSAYSTAQTIRTSAAPLPVPANVSATATATTVKVSWSAVSGATTYDVLFNGTVQNVISLTYVTFTGLSPQTTYTYAVRAKGPAPASDYSATQTIETLLNPPAEPTNVSATATTTSVTVSWGAVSGAASYDIKFDNTVTNVVGTSRTFTGLASGTSHTYQVSAKNTGGSSAYSSQQTIRTLISPPAVPSNVGATATGSTVTVSWSMVSGADTYEVLFDGTGYNAPGNARTFTGLAPETTYTYAVRARNSAGTSAYSAVKTIKTLIGPPPVPQNISATATTNSVTISWSAVSTATGYDVFFNGNVYNVTGTAIMPSGLNPETEYSYAVRAKNAGGAGPYSTVQKIWTRPVLPGVPAGISAIAMVNAVTVSWNTVNGATGYDLLFNNTVYSVTGTFTTVTGLLPRTSYSYQVRAKSGAGAGAYSAVQEVRTLLEVPDDIAATATITTVTVSFSPVNGATAYEVEFEGVTRQITGTSTVFTDLRPNTSFFFKVRAMDAVGYSEYSAGSTVKTLPDIPETPDNVRASSTMNSVTISWEPVNAASGYDVKFDDVIYTVPSDAGRASLRSDTERTVRADQDEAEELCTVFNGLKPNTKHSYSVRARDDRGPGLFSAYQTIRTQKYKKNGLPCSMTDRRYPDGNIPYLGLDPVNALSGSFLWSYTWLEDYGKDALHFTAMYDSRRDEAHRALGSRWTYSFEYLLYMDEEYAYFSTPYDEVVPFGMDAENGLFLPVEGIRYEYTMGKKETGDYYVRHVDGTEYVFAATLCLKQILEGGLSTLLFASDEEGRIIRIEGRHGGSLTIGYAGEHITRVSDVMGKEVLFTYEGDHLVTASNPDGRSLSYTYDASGMLVQVTDFAGKLHLTNRYDPQGRVIAQSIAGRGETFASYDETNRVTIFTDELGNDTKYRYDEALNVTSVERMGITVQSKYNSKGQLTEQIDGLGNSTKMAYDSYGHIERVTYPDGTEDEILCDVRNNPFKTVNRDNKYRFYQYDEKNNLISTADEEGRSTYFTYDSEGNLLTYLDKTRSEWTLSYDANNHLQQVSDPEEGISLYTHDAAGRLLSYTTPNGNTVTSQYSEAGDLLSMTDSDGTVTYTYDENGNSTSITDRMGNSRSFLYNEMGQISLETDSLGNESAFAYDRKGRLVKETDQLGFSILHEYDAHDNRTAQTDKNGETTRYTFDAGSQLIQVKDAAGGLINYVYDTMGQVRNVTDPLNNQTSYTRDRMGRITKVTNALGNSVSYTYDNVGNVKFKTDEDGVSVEYVYDWEDRVILILSELGTVEFTYDKLGRMIAAKDTKGFRETAQYDGDGNLIAFTDKESSTTAYTYDASGRLSEETDPLGGITSYTYDPNGNCIKRTDAQDNEFLYAYDADCRMIRETDPLGYETSYEYDARGSLKSVTDARGSKFFYVYDGNGNLIKEENPFGERLYTYDSMNRLTLVKDEEGHRRSYTYDLNGNMTSYTDANGNGWTYEYDAINRMTGMSDGDGGRLAIDYTKTGRIAKVTDQEGAETLYSYDSMGRLLKMSDALEHSLCFTYDSLGRILTQTDFNGNKTTYGYSPSGRLLSVKEPEGEETVYTYNALSQVLTRTDGAGGVTGYAYDALGQVTSITDPLGAKILFTYTANGKIATVTDEGGGVTHYAYDAGGNLTQLTDPMGGIVTYQYDSMNNRIKECLSTAEGQTCATIYQYDKRGRRIREINPLSEEKAYTYDGNGNITMVLDEDGQETRTVYDLNNKPVSLCYSDGREAAFRYNKRGELVEIADWNGVTAMEYGVTGRLSGVTDHNGRSIGYSYDANGNTTGITYPDGSVAGYAYDKNNRMIKVLDQEGQEAGYTYDSAGRILSIRQPGSSAACSYNAKGLPVKVEYQMEDGSFQEDTLAYDAAGRILSSARIGSSPEITRNAAYTYDALGRLTSCQDGQTTEAYGYDALGNRIYKKVNGIREATYQYNAWNQLTGRTEKEIPYSYGYDKRGNLTEEKRGNKAVRQYAYDTTGHMVLGQDLESGEKTEYFYNALNMRVKNVQTLMNLPGGYVSHGVQTENGGTPELFRTKEVSYVTDYLSGVNNELMTYEKGFGTARVVFGGGYQRLSQKMTPEPGAQETARGQVAQTTIGKAYFQSDLYGSVLFATDGQGKTLRHTARSVWGDLRNPVREDLNSAGVEESLRFTTYSYDPVIEKHFAQARFYDAGTGRMLSRDPVKRGLNGYPYCGNDPVNYEDSTGEVAHILAMAGIGGLGGGLFGLANYAFSQWVDGEDLNLREALGAAANGAAVGATRAAMVSTGIGALGLLASDFAAGAAGSAVEQLIVDGSVNVGRSVAEGLSNAAGSLIYGKNPVKSAGEALAKGMGYGAATSAINYISNAAGRGKELGSGKRRLKPQSGGAVRPGALPYIGMRDPRTGCGGSNPFSGNLAYSMGNGYRYEAANSNSVMQPNRPETKKKGSEIIEFVKEVAVAAVVGGLTSLGFHWAEKFVGNLVEKITSSIKGGSSAKYYNPDGSPIWPPNRGFEGKPSIESLKPGTLVDRYGYDGGTFVSPKGTPYTQRALPAGTDSKPYAVFEVLKPVEVNSGKIAPWFGEKGGGTQYEFNNKISELLKDNILRKVGS